MSDNHNQPDVDPFGGGPLDEVALMRLLEGEGLAEADALAGSALREASGVMADEGVRNMLAERLAAGTMDAFRSAAPPVLTLQGAEVGEGPSMLPEGSTRSVWYFVALAACLLMSITLAVRYGIQSTPAGTMIGESADRIAALKEAGELFADLSAEMNRTDLLSAGGADEGEGSVTPWAVKANALEAEITSLYSHLAMDQEHADLETDLSLLHDAMSDFSMPDDEGATSEAESILMDGGLPELNTSGF